MLNERAKLLILAGPPCSGKSTLAGLIESKLGFRWLQADRILTALIPDSRRIKVDRDIAYRAMHILAEELHTCGLSAVLDATYGSSEHRRAIELLAASRGAPVYLVECRVSPHVAADRFRSRDGHPAIDLDEVRVRNLATRYCYSRQGLTLESGTDLNIAIDRTNDYLKQSTPIKIDGSWSASSLGYIA